MVFQSVKSDIRTIHHFVSGHRRAFIARRIVSRLMYLAIGTLGAGLLLHVAFALFPWTALPLAWDLLVCGASLSACFILVDCVWLNPPSQLAIARKLDTAIAKPHALVSIALELSDAPDAGAGGLHAQVFSRAVAQIGPNIRIETNARRSARMTGITGVVLICWLTAFFLLKPRVESFWNLPLSMFHRAGARVVPGSIAVPRGSTVQLHLQPHRSGFPSSRLHIRPLDGKVGGNFLLRPDSTGRFSFAVDSAAVSFAYGFTLGGRAFGTDTITVVPPPLLRRLQVTLTAPRYMKAPPRVLREGQGSFSAYAGTTAKISIGANALDRGSIIRKEDTTAITIGNDLAYGEFVVWNQGSYTFSLIDTLGQKNGSLPVFHFGMLTDEHPAVHIVKPAANRNLTTALVETLFVEAVDDIGIKIMALQWIQSGTDSKNQGLWKLPLEGTPQTVRKQLIWNLKELSLYPGDTVFYWARVQDTKPFGAPQIAITDTFWFRIPGFEEIHHAIAEKEAYAEKTVGSVREKQDELSEMLKNLVKSATGSKELTWDQKQILDDVKQTVQAQTDSLQNALKSLEESIDRMKQDGGLGEEITRKMDEVAKALQELIKEFGDSLFLDKNDQNRDISLQEMKEAVEKARELLPELNERLENTLKFLEMLRRDQRLASLAARSEQLARDQAELSEEPQKDRALERQNDLLEKAGELSRDVGREMRDEGSNITPQDIPSSQQLDSLRKAMNEQMSSRSMPSGQTMTAMSGSLLSLSQELQQMLSSAMTARMQQERERLLAMSHDALTLAQWQQDLLDGEHMDAAKMAQAQQALRDALKKSMAKTDSLSMIPPDIQQLIRKAYSDALAGADGVLQALGQADGAMAMAQSKNALHGAADALLGAISGMQNGQGQGEGGGGGMMGGLKKLSGKQASINAATGDLLRSMMQGRKPGGSSEGGEGEGGQDARRAAQEAQKALADELKKLSEKYGKEAGEGLNKRVEQLEAEARRLAAMLSNPQPEIAERQDRFLARMLQTTLSLHRQDEGKEERKSRSSEVIYNDKIGGAVSAEQLRNPDTFHLLRRKALAGTFPENYRSAIKAYFDSLGVLFLKEN